MKRGHDGILRTVGGIEVKEPEIVKTRKTFQVPQDETIHTLYIVNSKYPPSPIQETKCRIVVTEKISWAEPIMPLRGKLRTQKRFMLGAMAFYLKSQAEKKKVMLLIQAMKAGPRHQTLANESYAQLKHFKETGELK